MLRDGVRHEALLFPDGGGRPSSPCRRSGGVKLRAAEVAGRRLRREQPFDEVRVGPGTAERAGRGERDEKVYARNVRHEALFVRMEVKDRPSPCRRSGGVKLEAA